MTAIFHANRWIGVEADLNNIVANNGQWFSALDTGNEYFRVSGAWVADPTGFIKATKSGRITTDENGVYSVVFETALADTNYTVALSTDDAPETNETLAHFSDLTTTGFTIHTRSVKNGHPAGSVVVSWLATRNYNP